MKRLLVLFLSIVMIVTFLCPLMALAEPVDPLLDVELEDPYKETFWEYWGFETVEEYMEWFVEDYWRDLSTDEPFWMVRYSSSMEDFMEWHGLDEDEYQILEDAWQKARKKALEDEIKRRNEELEGLGGTPGIINIMYNGQFIKFAGAVPENVGGSIFVPTKAFFKVLDATVSYDAKAHVIKAEFEDWSVDFAVGRDTMGITDETGSKDELQIGVAPFIKNDVSYIPVRAVAEALGFDVYWDRIYSAVVIFDSEKIIKEIDKDFTIVNSFLEMPYNDLPDVESTHKTVFDMILSVTQFNSIDGDKDATSKVNLTIISDGSNMQLTGVIDLSALYSIMYSSIPYYLYDDDEMESIDDMMEKYKDVTIDLILNYDEDILYIKAPILTETFPEFPEDAWIAFSGLDEFFDNLNFENVFGLLGMSVNEGKLSIGAIIYSDAFPYYFSYYDDDDYYYYYNYYSNYNKAIYKYSEIIADADSIKTLIGDDKFVKSSDGYKLSLTLDDYRAAMGEDDWYTVISEFDINVGIKMKDDVIVGIEGKFLYREITYYGESDTRYSGEFDISPEEIRLSIEIHLKNKMKVLIEVSSKTTETDAVIPGAPPKGEKVIPYEDLFDDDDEYYPNEIVPLLGNL